MKPLDCVCQSVFQLAFENQHKVDMFLVQARADQDIISVHKHKSAQHVRQNNVNKRLEDSRDFTQPEGLPDNNSETGAAR